MRMRNEIWIVKADLFFCFYRARNMMGGGGGGRGGGGGGGGRGGGGV